MQLAACGAGSSDACIKCIWVLPCMQEYVGQSMALHTRYPGHGGHMPVPGSPLGRAIDIIDSVFARCASPACLPRQGLPLVAYLGADNDASPLPKGSPIGAEHRPRHEPYWEANDDEYMRKVDDALAEGKLGPETEHISLVMRNGAPHVHPHHHSKWVPDEGRL